MLEVEGEELHPEDREPPDLNELAESHGNKSAIDDEAESNDRPLEDHPMEEVAEVGGGTALEEEDGDGKIRGGRSLGLEEEAKVELGLGLEEDRLQEGGGAGGEVEDATVDDGEGGERGAKDGEGVGEEGEKRLQERGREGKKIWAEEWLILSVREPSEEVSAGTMVAQRGSSGQLEGCRGNGNQSSSDEVVGGTEEREGGRRR